MKPDLFRLIKQGSILTWKVAAILGGAVAAWLQSDTDEESEAGPTPEIFPWDASRVADPEYIDAAAKQGIAWDYDGEYRPERIYGDFRS